MTGEKSDQGNIYEALRYMLGMDQDRAIARNDVGFNKFDSDFGHKLGDDLNRYGSLTPKQLNALRKMLKKYVKNQLGDLFDLDRDVETRQPRKASTTTTKDTTKSTGSSSSVSGEKRVFKATKGNRDIIGITFPYTQDDTIRQKIKSIPRWFWNKSKKRWEVPYTVGSYVLILDLLGGNGFTIEQVIIDAFESEADAVRLKKEKSKASKLKAGETLEIPGLGGELRPFQEVGVDFIRMTGYRALLADEMGLGKTVMALASLQHIGYTSASKVIAIVPAGIKRQWLRESEKWLSDEWTKTIIETGKTPLPENGLIIISYTLATRRKDELLAWSPDFVIADECHFLKNRKSKRSKAIAGTYKGRGRDKKRIPGIATEAKYFLGLSGTPFLNRVMELFPILHTINPHEWSNGFRFGKKYTNAQHNGFGWTFEGTRNEDELRERLSELMLRREKEDVLKELPAKQYAPIVVDIDNRKEYDRAEMTFLRWLEENEGWEAVQTAMRAEALVKINYLRQLTARGKVASAIEWTTNFLESTDQKLIIFAHHKAIVDAISAALDEAVIAHRKFVGGMSDTKKDKAVQSFQNDPKVRVLIISKAGGHGLNLTAASNLLKVERLWNPPQEWQVEDRTHRMGQTDRVTIWELVANETIDDHFASLLIAKKGYFDEIIKGQRPDDVEAEIIDNVITRLTEGK
jgi:SWI/SNF-related matrix-associated actin-dependent regulator 1 of chromatin subfamily A